jgi:hypothetical protein
MLCTGHAQRMLYTGHALTVCVACMLMRDARWTGELFELYEEDVIRTAYAVYRTRTCCVPDTHSVCCVPDTHSVCSVPDTHTRHVCCVPDTYSVCSAPDTHMRHVCCVPDTLSVCYVPDTH